MRSPVESISEIKASCSKVLLFYVLKLHHEQGEFKVSCTASNLAVAVGVEPNTMLQDQSRY